MTFLCRYSDEKGDIGRLGDILTYRQGWIQDCLKGSESNLRGGVVPRDVAKGGGATGTPPSLAPS